MKTASVLFGLVVATGVAHGNPAPVHRAPTQARSLPAAMHSLLRQKAAPVIQLAVARPRVDAKGDMACGNVMKKTSADDDDSCTTRTASTGPQAPVQSLTVVVQPAARPLLASDGDVAPGNVMKATKK